MYILKMSYNPICTFIIITKSTYFISLYFSIFFLSQQIFLQGHPIVITCVPRQLFLSPYTQVFPINIMQNFWYSTRTILYTFLLTIKIIYLEANHLFGCCNTRPVWITRVSLLSFSSGIVTSSDVLVNNSIITSEDYLWGDFLSLWTISSGVVIISRMDFGSGGRWLMSHQLY